jgi:hypothetical protein
MKRFRLIGLLVILTFVAVTVVAASAIRQMDQDVDVTFFLSMIEIKGATTVDSLAAPDVDPRTLSEGYRYRAPGDLDPNDPDRWEVASYIFSDQSMMVRQGDRVRLTLFGVNGNSHVVYLQSPSGEIVVEAQELQRGREYDIEFTAEEAGYYKLVCPTHGPTMTTNILAIP